LKRNQTGEEKEDEVAYTDPPGGCNVATNTILPRFFEQKVATKVATFLA
jgi:hypothetical protein